MGFMFSNITGTSVIVGAGIGFAPLCSQAFGAKNYRRCGILLQRQLVLHTCICLPIAVLWAGAGPLLAALGQPAGIAELAGVFILYRLPGLFFMMLNENLGNFLKSQCIMQVTLLFTGCLVNRAYAFRCRCLSPSWYHVSI